MRKHDEKYYEEQLEQYKGLIVFFTKKYNISNYTHEDLFQEFSMLLVKALDNYDVSRGASFDTFYTAYIRRWIHKELRKNSREKRGDLLLIFDDEESNMLPNSDKLDEYIDDAKTPDELEKEGREIEFIEEQLKEMKYGVYSIGILFDGLTLQEVAKENGVSFQFVQQEHKKNLSHMRDLLLEHDFIKGETK